MDIEEVLHDKALETIGGLLASYEAGRISVETFKVGVETIWGCLGGVVRNDEFKDLMRLANKEIAHLSAEPRIRVLTNGTSALVLMRTGEHVRMIAADRLKDRIKDFELDDEAIGYVATLEANAARQGFREYE